MILGFEEYEEEVEKTRSSIDEETGKTIEEKYIEVELRTREALVENKDLIDAIELEYSEEITSPVFDGEKIIQFERTPTQSEVKKGIGDKIVLEAFENNPHEQIADLTSAVVGLAYLVSLSHGKQAVQQALGPLIDTITRVSDVREDMGLSRFDISFLE